MRKRENPHLGSKAKKWLEVLTSSQSSPRRYAILGLAADDSRLASPHSDRRHLTRMRALAQTPHLAPVSFVDHQRSGRVPAGQGRNDEQRSSRARGVEF